MAGAFLTAFGLLTACLLGGIGAAHLFWGDVPQTVWAALLILAGLALLSVLSDYVHRD